VGPGNNVLLQARNYSCFCESCVGNGREVCPNNKYVAAWKVVTLEPCTNEEAVQEKENLDEEWLAKANSDALAAELEVGDHFAILADTSDPESKGAEFFILLCTKQMFVVQNEVLTDAWGGKVDRADEVVEGLYYEQHGKKLNSYVLVADPGPARVYSHLVCASKFCMKVARYKQKSKTSVYELSDAALAKIERVLQDRKRAEALHSEDDDDDLDTDHEDPDSEPDYDSFSNT